MGLFFYQYRGDFILLISKIKEKIQIIIAELGNFLIVLTMVR